MSFFRPTGQGFLVCAAMPPKPKKPRPGAPGLDDPVHSPDDPVLHFELVGLRHRRYGHSTAAGEDDGDEKGAHAPPPAAPAAMRDMPSHFGGPFSSACHVRNIREVQIGALTRAVRRKRDWRRKLDDPAIAARCVECTQSSRLRVRGLPVCCRWKREMDRAAVYGEPALQLLRCFAAASVGDVELSEVDGVWQSDTRIPPETKAALLAQVSSCFFGRTCSRVSS